MAAESARSVTSPRRTPRDRLARAWPHLRAAFVVYHVLAVIILSLPPSTALLDRRAWATANFAADVEGYAAALRGLGVDTDAARLRGRLLAAARGWAALHQALAAPFVAYGGRFARQGWQMFATPQRHPAELHVDLLEGGAWRPLYRPRSAEHAWRRGLFDHNRVRKLFGRFARAFDRRIYDEIAHYLAEAALADHPAAEAARVGLYRYRTLPPERVRVGERPVGEFTEVRVRRREEAR